MTYWNRSLHRLLTGGFQPEKWSEILLFAWFRNNCLLWSPTLIIREKILGLYLRYACSNSQAAILETTPLGQLSKYSNLFFTIQQQQGLLLVLRTKTTGNMVVSPCHVPGAIRVIMQRSMTAMTSISRSEWIPRQDDRLAPTFFPPSCNVFWIPCIWLKKNEKSVLNVVFEGAPHIQS